jgi:hypothetical protein
VGQYALLYRLVDPFHSLKLSKGADCAGGIGMAIIGTDDEPQLPRVLHDVRHIVIGLARDVDLVLLENVLRERPAAYCVANRDFGRSKAPTGRRLR